MAHEFKLLRQVEFSETDAAGIVHFSNFFRYMEAAEHAFFRSLGLSIHSSGEEQRVGWPRVHADCDYRHPLRFEDKVEVRLKVKERRERTIVYGFTFWKVDHDPPKMVARGSLITACVERDAAGALRSVPIPPDIAALIETAQEETPATC